MIRPEHLIDHYEKKSVKYNQLTKLKYLTLTFAVLGINFTYIITLIFSVVSVVILTSRTIYRLAHIKAL